MPSTPEKIQGHLEYLKSDIFDEKLSAAEALYNMTNRYGYLHQIMPSGMSLFSIIVVTFMSLTNEIALFTMKNIGWPTDADTTVQILCEQNGIALLMSQLSGENQEIQITILKILFNLADSQPTYLTTIVNELNQTSIKSLTELQKYFISSPYDKYSNFCRQLCDKHKMKFIENTQSNNASIKNASYTTTFGNSTQNENDGNYNTPSSANIL